MRRLWNGFSRTVDQTSRWSSIIAGVLVIPLTIVVVYAALMRTFTPFSPDWSFLTTLFLFGTAIMLSGADVLRRNEHVAVDILPAILPRKAGDALRIFGSLVIIIVAAVFVYIGADMAWQSTLINERSAHPTSFDPPIWWFRWVIPISGFLLLLEGIRQLGDQIRLFGKLKDQETSPTGNVPTMDPEKGDA